MRRMFTDAHHSILCTYSKEKSKAASAKCSISEKEANAILGMYWVNSVCCEGEQKILFL